MTLGLVTSHENEGYGLTSFATNLLWITQPFVLTGVDRFSDAAFLHLEAGVAITVGVFTPHSLIVLNFTVYSLQVLLLVTAWIVTARSIVTSGRHAMT